MTDPMTTQSAGAPGLPELPKPAIPVVYAPAGGFVPTPRSETVTISMPQPYFTADQMNAHYLKGYEAGSAAAAQAVPEGFVLVPREPTFEMNKAGQEAVWDFHPDDTIEGNEETARAAYFAMLDAAPTQGAEGAAPQATDGAFAALRALTEAVLTRADNDYLRRQLDAAVKVMAARGCESPVPWPDTDFGVANWGAPQAVVGEASEQSQALNNLHATLKQALRIPGLPFPDPHAHSLDAYARAVHSAYCQLRFKIMDSIKLVESAMTVPAALTPSLTPTAPQEADALREALKLALKALEAIGDEMTVGERYTNAGQYLLDALEPARAALAQHQPQQGEQHE